MKIILITKQLPFLKMFNFLTKFFSFNKKTPNSLEQTETCPQEDKRLECYDEFENIHTFNYADSPIQAQDSLPEYDV